MPEAPPPSGSWKRSVFLFFLTIIVVVVGAWFTLYMFGYFGRTPSRLVGRAARQIIEVEHMKEFISLSLYRDGETTVKDVTFVADDNYVYTAEYRDRSLLDFGSIRWVPHDEDSSIIRTRAISRWTSAPVNLRLPEDCAEILQVILVREADSDNRTKNLVYRTVDGTILSKEYRDGLVSRNFAGWIEVRRQ